MFQPFFTLFFLRNKINCDSTLITRILFYFHCDDLLQLEKKSLIFLVKYIEDFTVIWFVY